MSGLRISQLPSGVPSLSGIVPFTNDSLDETFQAPVSSFLELQTLGSLSDVDLSGVEEGNFITYNSGTWIAGLLPSVSGSGYVVTSFDNNIYNVSVTGVQPSGNYSLVGHTHNSSDITDFNTSVSGLLPVKNVLGSGNINITSSSQVFTISSSGLVQSNTVGIVGASGVNNIVHMTQANYNALVSKDPNTVYFIV